MVDFWNSWRGEYNDAALKTKSVFRTNQYTNKQTNKQTNNPNLDCSQPLYLLSIYSPFTHAKEKASKASSKHAGVGGGVISVLCPYPVKSSILRWCPVSL